jgi:hypothetical protein
MKKLSVTATLIMCALLTTFVVVIAYNPYLGTFNDLYGTSGKTLDTCETCHSNGLNGYGEDFLTKFNELGDRTAALEAIEPLDSDNDGDSNIAEINAGTFPGNGASNLPVEGSTWGKIKSLYE